MRRRWRVLARHKWVAGCTITESSDVLNSTKEVAIRRFTATILGHQNWLIYEGPNIGPGPIIKRVREIKDRIEANDESVFHEAETLPPARNKNPNQNSKK